MSPICRCNSVAAVLATIALLFTSPAFAESNYEELCEQGRQYIDKNDPDGAICQYSTAIVLKPDEAIAYVCRALSYRAKSDFTNALVDCNKAISLVPKAVPPYLIRGSIYQAQNRLDEAIADYTEAISCDQKRSYSYLARAKAYRVKKKDEFAIADFRHAIECEDSNVNAHLELANAYRDMGNAENAILEFSNAIHYDDKYAASYFFRAKLLFDRKQMERAIDDCQKAIKFDKEGFPAAKGLLAAAHFSQRNFASAAKLFDAAAKSAPEPIAYLWVGKAHCENGDYQAAVESFDKAITINPQFIPAYVGRAYAYEKLKKKDKAELDIKTAQQLGSTPGARLDPGATNMMALVDRLYSVTKGLSTESIEAHVREIEKKPSTTDLAMESAQTVACLARQKAVDLRKIVIDIGPDIIAPIPATEAVESFRKASDLFGKRTI